MASENLSASRAVAVVDRNSDDADGGRALATLSKESALTLRNEMFSMEEMEGILLDLGVRKKHVHVALDRARATKEPLAQIMRDFNFLSGEGVAQAVSRQTRLAYFPAEAVDKIRKRDLASLKMADFKRYVPVGRRRSGELLVAVADANTVNDARNMFRNERTEIVIASEHTIQTVYRKYFAQTEKAVDDAIKAFEETNRAGRRGDEDESTLGIVRKIYFAIIRHACYSGASDLQLYRSEHVGIVRLKINGVGHIFRTVSPELYHRLTTKMVQDNAAKLEDLRNKPKEARIRMTDDDAKEYPDLATRFGFRLELAMTRERVTATVRILDKDAATADFKSLPFDEETRRRIEKMLHRSHGFFIVTGPTGSGKTTTLYSCLKEIDAVDRSVQSVENPIEYTHGLWMQYELRSNATSEGDEYHEMVKMLLRNAPDVVLIGEIRDRNVANACVDAANTGHLVLGTLHTNDAPLSLARLKSFQIDPSLLGNVLLGILAQRLVRTLCTACSQPDTSEATAEALDAPYLANAMKTPRCAGEGCEDCDFTGYRGRRMIYELLEVNKELRELIENDAPVSAIARSGMTEDKRIWARGLQLVAAGLTSLTELEQKASPDV